MKKKSNYGEFGIIINRKEILCMKEKIIKRTKKLLEKIGKDTT